MTTGPNPPLSSSACGMPSSLRISSAPTPGSTPRQVSGSQRLEYIRAASETTPLPEHLFHRGFRDGRHSDITVHAFGSSYPLHRLLLDRSPFFSSALSEPWFESTAKEITLHPEEIDPNITQPAFELALRRLYGLPSLAEEREVAAALLATGCWLEMADVVECSVECLLRQMTPENLASVIDLVSASYYGKAGERLLSSGRAMLYREGWEMPIRYWDGISGDMIRHIVGGDGFFVAGEWERWLLVRRLLNRRLRIRLMNSAPTESVRANPTVTEPTRGRSRNGKGRMDPRGAESPSADVDLWESIYAHSDVVALQVLLDSGIHYMHMTFEQLQCIQTQVDILGNPFVQTETIKEALWRSMDLRQRIVNAPETAAELGLRHSIEDVLECREKDLDAGGKKSRWQNDEKCLSTGSRSPWFESDVHGFGSAGAGEESVQPPRRFWIPNVDSTRVIGDKLDTSSRAATSRVLSRSNLPLPSRGDEANAFLTHLRDSIAHSLSPAPSPSNAKGATAQNAATEERVARVRFSHFPPCRFSVVFPHPRSVKEKKRVYSRTVRYAGSMWNVYIQKLQSSKNVQLGVYLHRVREIREGEEMTAGGGAQVLRSVDDAISQLERDMLARRYERRAARRPNQHLVSERPAVADPHLDPSEDPGNSSGDNATQTGNSNTPSTYAVGTTPTSNRQRGGGDLSSIPPGRRAPRDPVRGLRGAVGRPDRLQVLENVMATSPSSTTTATLPRGVPGPATPTSTVSFGAGSNPVNSRARSSAHPNIDANADADDSEEDEDDYEGQAQLDADLKRIATSVPALPAYVDARPTIKTYFKIYQMSPEGRTLSVHKSAPDVFNFSQSWGWKSVLDETMLGTGTAAIASTNADSGARGMALGKDDRLRFSIVLGNV
ncbi:MAG: hypothetical protein M1826_003460 [Phylliscum demangeonii]|nr:MAG: hypothetical protein M1826_003460 [Phylliscum demangeonii]